MVGRTYTEELIEELRKLGEVERKRVLEYARNLSHRRPKGASAEEVLKHFGVLSDKGTEEISLAIEEGCE